jgi:hypothetical protein
MLGALLKMKLVGYQDSKFSKLTGFAYQAQINPESYSLDHTVVLNNEQPQGKNGQASTFIASAPRKLTCELVFDATGAIGDTPADLAGPAGIVAQVKAFKLTTYTYFGNSHRSPYVLLQWGSLIFPCQLETMSLAYKLFSPEGVPLRATAKVSFQEVVEDTKLARLANALSADLTHIRTVRAGDTLPQLCHEVYGDATLYSKVAAVNQLTNLRSLRLGQQLAFPPLVPAPTGPTASAN